jgi:hypothetical protein
MASTCTAEVPASSLYEAAALGVPEFRRCGLMDTQSCLKSCAASGCANLAFALT